MSQAVANLAMNAKAEAEAASKAARDAQEAIASIAERLRQIEDKIERLGPRNSNK